MNDPILLQLALQAALIALNAVFACAEIAVLSAGDLRLARLAQQGDRRAVRLRRLTSAPARFLATIQVAITLSGFLGSAFAADNFSDRLVDFLLAHGVPLPEKTLDAVSVVLITLLLSYFTLVFGELVPKRLAMKRAEQLALALSGLIGFISGLFAPIVWLLTVSTDAVLRLFGVSGAERDGVTEEEIRMMVDAGSEQGVLEADEREIIRGVFELDDRTARELATHRTALALLRLEESDAQWAETIRGTRHARYPVCDGTADRVIGVLTARDYFVLDDRRRANVLAHAVHPACFVPESVRGDVLLRQMRRTRQHFAVVLDEYGGLEGVVTLADLLGELVGDLPDEHAPPEAAIAPLEGGAWRITGNPPLAEVAERTGAALPAGAYDTLGGLVFGALGTVPADGSSFELEVAGLHVRVLEVRGHCLARAVVRRTAPAPGARE